MSKQKHNRSGKTKAKSGTATKRSHSGWGWVNTFIKEAKLPPSRKTVRGVVYEAIRKLRKGTDKEVTTLAMQMGLDKMTDQNPTRQVQIKLRGLANPKRDFFCITREKPKKDAKVKKTKPAPAPAKKAAPKPKPKPTPKPKPAPAPKVEVKKKDGTPTTAPKAKPKPKPKPKPKVVKEAAPAPVAEAPAPVAEAATPAGE